MAKMSSNYKELSAIFQALEVSENLLVGSHVQIQSDNSTAVAYLNKQGGTKNQELMNLTFKIFSLAENKFLSLSAVFLTGRENLRWIFSVGKPSIRGDWCLEKAIFQKIIGLWGRPEIDLFATKKKRQVKNFCSLNPADHPWAVDAFWIR